MEQEKDKTLTTKEKAFYDVLFENVVQDWQDVYDEGVENDEKYGKDDDGSENLWDFMDKVRTKAPEETVEMMKKAWKAKKAKA